jgi:uncharacterized membrane protein
MWERAALKYNAKQVLGGTYWISFAACLVAGILGGAGGVSYQYGGGRDAFSGGGSPGGFGDAALLFALFFGVFMFAMVIGIAVAVFFSQPVQAGLKYFFIRTPYGDTNFGNIFTAFKAGRYLSIVKTLFFMNLYVFLWGLLFVIPGIVKAYQYRMVPYLITEDPNLTTEQALELSRRMTYGEKWAMFVLDLSFIGWGLLATLTFGIGFLFLAPYIEATQAQLYFALRPKVMAPPQIIQ